MAPPLPGLVPVHLPDAQLAVVALDQLAQQHLRLVRTRSLAGARMAAYRARLRAQAAEAEAAANRLRAQLPHEAV